MKILEVNKLYYPWLGGVETTVQKIAENFNKKEGFKVEVLCCSPSRGDKDEEINGVAVHRASGFGVHWGMPISFSFFNLFRKLSRNFDVIEFHHPFPLSDLALFFFPPRAKINVYYHSDIVRQKILELFYRPFVLHTLRKASHIIVSNPNMIKNSPYLEKFREKCVVIPHGIDLDEIREGFNEEEIESLKKEYGKFVLFAGRLSHYKGVVYLIEAMQSVDANLVVIGEGGEENLLKKRVEELHLEKKILFLPPQERKKLINFYAATRVFVLPSILKSEAFGIVLAEAMACGTPVISTELGTGTSFVNRDGETGFVVPPENAAALAESISKILNDEETAKRFGANAKKRAEEEFSIEKMIGRIVELEKAL